MSDPTDAERLKLVMRLRQEASDAEGRSWAENLRAFSALGEWLTKAADALESAVAEKRAAEKERDIEKNIATGYHAKWVIADDAYAARPRDKGNHD